MPKKDFSKAVKEKLREKRLNVPKMASFLNIPETQLRNWMARNRFLEDATKSICSYLNMDENDYNLTYIDPYKSVCKARNSVKQEDIGTLEDARKHARDTLYEGVVHLINRLYLTSHSEIQDNIVRDLEQIVEKYPSK